ncbi:MAG: hypothetical protein K2L14_06900 [Duncaniella sp.]|nr:hypothetical protein [Duncaniella sp.]
MRRHLAITAVAAVSIALHSCFTGVESTPRIGAGEVRKETASAVAEDTVLAGVLPEPFDKWTPGKQFLVDDSRISLLFGTTLPAGRDLRGDTLLYAGSWRVTDFAGQPATILRFTDTRFPADTLEYKVNSESPAELPFAVQLSMVEKARDILTGRTFYLLTRSRRDSADNIIPGRRYVPVTVDSVMPGTAVNPVKISFTDDAGKQACLYMPGGASPASPRRFGAVLAVNDPRRRYPAVTDEVWENIIDGKVAAGMTRDECRLSLGKPASVDRIPGSSYLYERWAYDNGIYLIFEDGVLTQFRR